MSRARPLRYLGAAIAVVAYLVAAMAPCPAVTGSSAGRMSSRAPLSTTHAAHHDHRDASRNAESVHAGTRAEFAALCACGCGRRAGTVSMARLGPVLLSGVVAFALPASSAFEISLPRRATSIALALPDPVPIARFA